MRYIRGESGVAEKLADQITKPILELLCRHPSRSSNVPEPVRVFEVTLFKPDHVMAGALSRSAKL